MRAGTPSIRMDYPLTEVGIRVGQSSPPHGRARYTVRRPEHTHT